MRTLSSGRWFSQQQYAMKLWYIAIVVGLVSIAQAVYLPDVTPKTFDKELDPSKRHILVEFYAPWCGHCKALAPEFERFGKAFANNPNVVVAQVDADKYRKLGKKFNVEGFPTMKFIGKGKTFKEAEDVNERTAEGLIRYLNDKTGLRVKEEKPETKVVELTPENFDEVVKKEKPAFVGFFAPWCGHCKAMKEDWEKLAGLYDDEDIVIGSVDADRYNELGTKYEVSGFPTIKLFKGDEIVDYKEARKLESFVEFVNEQVGMDVAIDGGVVQGGGVIHEIKEALESFKKAESEEDRAKALEVCNERAQELDDVGKGKYAYYERMLKKIIDKGVEYVKSEKKRLSNILGGGNRLKTKQRRSMMRRVNVLTQFDEL